MVIWNPSSGWSDCGNLLISISGFHLCKPSRVNMSGRKLPTASRKKQLMNISTSLLPSPDKEVQEMFVNKGKVQKDFKAVASEDISLSCEVAQAKTEGKWFKDGKLITSSKKFKVEAEGRSRRLIVQQVERKDGGEYTCEAGGQKLTFKVTVAGRRRKVLPCFRIQM
uniref:Ig-like domain-containing protein n=1 Tax=Laticauda laticaudata TaxID=8630 RepID=A0A8C5SHD8_LATLA